MLLNKIIEEGGGGGMVVVVARVDNFVHTVKRTVEEKYFFQNSCVHCFNFLLVVLVATTPKRRRLLKILRQVLRALHFCEIVVDKEARLFFEVLHLMHVNPRFITK